MPRLPKGRQKAAGCKQDGSTASNPGHIVLPRPRDEIIGTKLISGPARRSRSQNTRQRFPVVGGIERGLLAGFLGGRTGSLGVSDWTTGPIAGDILVYDDNFDTIQGILTDNGTYLTTAARDARVSALAGGVAEYFFYNALSSGQITASLQTAGGGLHGSPRYLRLDAINTVQAQLTYNALVNHGNHPDDAHRFCPAGATLVVEIWSRIDTSSAPLFGWLKGLELEDNTDRTQYGVYLTGNSRGWANIHPDSNNKEIYMHLENGASDAPVLYKRWANISGQGWLHNTYVYRTSSGVGTQRDGMVLWYVESEKIIDGSRYGLDNGWMVGPRQVGFPYSGNVGDVSLSVTGDQALLGLSDLEVRRISYPGIINLSNADGLNSARLEIGRVRIWYRPAPTPVFTDSFASGDFTYTQNGYNWWQTNGAIPPVVVSLASPYGSKAACFEYGPDTVTPGDDSSSELRFRFGAFLSEFWYEYFLLVPSNFIHRQVAGDTYNNKFFVVWHASSPDGYSQANDWLYGVEYDGDAGNDGGSRVRAWTGTGTVIDIGNGSSFDPTAPQTKSIKMINNGQSPNAGAWDITPGVWAQVRHHVKVGTQNHDGIAEMWLNGQLAFQAKNHNWDGTPLSIGAGYLMGYADSGFTAQTKFHITRVRIYQQNPGW